MKPILFAAIAAGFFSTMPLRTSAGDKLISRDLLFGNPERAALRVSPDGKHVSYLAPVNGVLNVWVAPTDQPDQGKPVTSDTKRGIRQYQWAFTSEHIVYLQDQGGNENWNVHVVDLSTSKDTNLTPNPAVNARLETFSIKHPDQIVVGTNDRNPQLHDLHLINIRTAENSLLLENPGTIEGNNVVSFAVDDDYKVRLAGAIAPDGGIEIYKPGDAAGSWVSLLKAPMEDSLTTQPIGFDRSGQTFYYRDSRGRDTSAFFEMNAQSGESKLLAEDPHADAGGMITNPSTGKVEAVSFNYDRERWMVLDDSIKPDLEYLQSVTRGDINVTSRTQDDKVWTVAFIPDNGPAKFYLYNRDKRNAQFVFSNRKELESVSLVKMHPVVIKSRDGMDLVCYYSLPFDADPDQDGKPDKPVPMVLDVHGGPWARDQWGFNPEHQWLANRGYAVLSVNYRGSTGFGKKFINAANKEWAGKMHEDLIDAVNWAVNNQICPKDKVAIMGGSYGGYATLVGMTFTPDAFACGVDIVGPSSLVTLINSIPPYWKPMAAMWHTRVGDPNTTEGKAFLESRSPLTLVDRINKPLLIGQGANDPRVKQHEADQIARAMNEKKIPVTYVLYPDEGHGFARPENRLSFYAIAEAFLAQHLGGKVEEIGSDFQGSSIKVVSGADQVPGLKSAITSVNSSEK